MWPRVAVSGTNKNTVHVIGTLYPENAVKAGIIEPVVYCRSTDGGANWDVVSALLPGEDTLLYKNHYAAEDYDIDANGDNVAIVMGGNHNSVVTWKSTDNGNTWVKKAVWNFPVLAFDPESSATIADTITCFDGSLSLVLDNNAKIHIWGGVTRFLKSDPAAGSYYFPGISGLLYWNDAMNTITGKLDTSSHFCWPFLSYVDRNNDGIFKFSNQALMFPMNCGATSQPSGSFDADGNLYVLFESVAEEKDSTKYYVFNSSDTVMYKHIFELRSTDGGANWLDVVELTPFSQYEYVFPSITKFTEDSIRFIVQGTDIPGNSLQPTTGNLHPAGYEKDIVYFSYHKTFNSVKEKISINNNLKLYPNPVNEFAVLNFNTPKTSKVNISIHNLVGQQVASYNYNSVVGENNFNINASDLQSGVYFLKVQSEGKNATTKFVKM